MLGDELGTASNIKSRVNRQSVLGAITSAQQRLKLYNKVPMQTRPLCFMHHAWDVGSEKLPEGCLTNFLPVVSGRRSNGGDPRSKQ